MKIKKGILFVAIIALLLVIGACSEKTDTNSEADIRQESLDNLTGKEMPIVNEEITLNIFAGKSDQNLKSDWNDLTIWNKYAEMSNINVNWEQVGFDALSEKRNLTLIGDSDKLPDAFYAARIPELDLLKYGQQDVFIPLSDLIDEYAPNLKKLLDEYPEIKKSITFPDGEIYSLPTIYDAEFSSLLVGASPWFNTEWLDELGVDIPKTTDEFYDFLSASKKKGESMGKEVIPFGSTSINYLFDWIYGAFGVSNRGVGSIDIDKETNDLRFYPTTDEYKEMLEYVHKLYDEKLIDPSIYTHEHADYLNKAENGIYASYFYYSSTTVDSIYDSGYALEGPNGNKEFVGLSHPVHRVGQFAITAGNEHPEATMRWVDYFYGDEGAKLFYMGIEGETYEETADGTYEYVERITNSPDGLSLNEEISKDLAWVGAGAPGILKQDYFSGSEGSPRAIEAAKKLEPDFLEEKWPTFLYTDEENKRLSVLASDIDKYVKEMRDRFVTGDVSFDEWEAYKKEIDSMGLEEYMEIKGAAFKRYSEN